MQHDSIGNDGYVVAFSACLCLADGDCVVFIWEVEEWRRRDPITRLQGYLIESGEIDDAEDEEINREIKTVVDEAEAFAEASPLPKPEDALLYVCDGAAEIQNDANSL